MRLLFLGDVSARSGRDAVIKHLPTLKAQLQPDVVIVNGENAAAGFGLTMKLAQDFFDAGVDCLTTGNHVWNQKELVLQIDNEPRILRPLNFREDTPGKGFYLHKLKDGRKILITNLIGRLFITDFLSDDPFQALEKLLARFRLGDQVAAIFVDFHAEATSEKMSMGHIFDGRVSAVVGTHTHIPTADEQILPKGTAYHTDAGMCGDYNSVIGIKPETSAVRFVRHYPVERMAPADGEATVCGTYIETDDTTGLALRVDAVRIGGRLKPTLPEKA